MSKVDGQRALRDARFARYAAAKAADESPGNRGAAPKKATKAEPDLDQPLLLDAPAPAAVAAVGKGPDSGLVAEAPQPVLKAVQAQPGPEISLEPCGHARADGKTCTREAGHPQKNHRFA